MIDTLVYIDDDELDQVLLSLLVKRKKCVKNLIQFRRATEALDFLRDPASPKIDAILLDINMPKMNGFEFLDVATKEFGNKFAQAVVVMLTTSILPEERELAMSYYVVKAFFKKPPTSEHLVELTKIVKAQKNS